MAEHSLSSEKKKENIKQWLRDKDNLLLLFIIAVTVLIRLYYFFHTQGQALWWDEAEYMSTAKKWAFGIPYELNPQRPPLFQFMSAIAFMIGFGENFVKFMFVVVPSILVVFIIYSLGRDMYNKKVGLMASFLAAVSWTFVFWSSRVQPDSFSLLFQVLSISYMWRYWKSPKTKLIVLSGFFAALGFYFKVSALLVPIIFFIFIIIKDRLSAFKKKDYYLFAFAFFVTMIPYFIWSYQTFGTFTAFRTGYSDALGTTTPFGWYNLGFFYSLTENIFFILFLIGLLISVRFLIYVDVLVKDKNSCFNPDLLGVLSLIVVSAFYIFYIRGTEDRWVFLWMPFIFFMASNALTILHRKLFSLNKNFALVIVIGLVLVIAYLQLGHAKALVDSKKESYMQVKFAGEWIKQHSNKNDLVMTQSQTQIPYYSERRIAYYGVAKNESDFDNYVLKNKPRLLTISVFENHPAWLQSWMLKNQNKTTPVNAYFADQEKKVPLLVIYEVKYG